MTLLCPLAFLRKLDSLKVTSYIALCAIAYLVSLFHPSLIRNAKFDSFEKKVFIVLFYTFLDASELPAPGEVELFKFGPSFIQSLPVQIFGTGVSPHRCSG